MHHPQLLRFREHASPLGAIAEYLRIVEREASRRGYRFARERIGRALPKGRLTVPRGQLEFEWSHLMRKLRARDPARRTRLSGVGSPRAHPLFRVVRGGISAWEKTAAGRGRPASR